MYYIAFLPDQYIKDNSWINQHVDPSIIRPAVRIAQEKYILPLLGTALYNKLTASISGSPATTLTGDYGTLLNEYVRPTLLHYVVKEATFPISIRIANKNLVRRNSDNSSPADYNEILTMRDEAKTNAEMYGERMRRYLLANPSLFPEYLNPGTGVDTIYPESKTWTSPLSTENYHANSGLTRNKGYSSSPTVWDVINHDLNNP